MLAAPFGRGSVVWEGPFPVPAAGLSSDRTQTFGPETALQ